jgi:hypothetical protein
METLTVWVAERVAAFPRKHRFTVGDRWIDTCLDVQTLLLEASYVRDKRGLLLRASRGLIRARSLARIAGALRCMSTKQQVYFEGQSAEIGRMVGTGNLAGELRGERNVGFLVSWQEHRRAG